MNVAQKLIHSHLVEGELVAGREIAIRIDQTLTQDATGTLVMLELEAMGIDRVRNEVSVQYVDHNLIQEDYKNADDHLFLLSACQRFGIWYSRPGNGVSHPLHMERFGKPGKTLLGSDSHTPASGALGMLAIGAGGIEVALAMAGQPFRLTMPKIWGVRLVGEMPDWVSAKDVILELLRRHDVSGGVGRIVEYHGPGLEHLTAMDRHVIANMGAELGATTSVFPSDEETRRFLAAQGREEDWSELVADAGATYDFTEEIDLSKLEPMIAMPSSPGNVVTVREVAGQPIYQSYVGSSANPGYRDFAIAARIVEGRTIDPRVSFDINPSSRQVLENLVADGEVARLLHSGARIHQAGCNGCIGMGQAPATQEISLRTVPRNFPGRSGTREDKVCLVSPETAAASALTGKITDPRTLPQTMGIDYPHVEEPRHPILNTTMFVAPLPGGLARRVRLQKGPNIAALPELAPLPEELEIPVLLKVGDNISTDTILPAGTRVLPYRSNIPRIAEFAFDLLDDTYPRRAKTRPEGHLIVGGRNYGQGSSREHAALAPRYLGLRAVIAKSFARIHVQNLINFGVLPLLFAVEEDYDDLALGDVIALRNIPDALRAGRDLLAQNVTRGYELHLHHAVPTRQIEVLLRGGHITEIRQQLTEARKVVGQGDHFPGT